MKNYSSFTCAAIFFAVMSCTGSEHEPEPVPAPVINVETDYSASYEAGTHKLRYSISDPAEGSELNASTDVPWIEDVVVGEAELSFGLTLNEGDSERFGTISLRYPGADDVTVNIVQEAPPVKDLSSYGTANCYIVSRSGTYFFRTVKGNSSEPVGDVASAEVLWESFGTSVPPAVGDLIPEVSFCDGNIIFSTSEVFKEGNAVIAALDDNHNILWSWHIWLTDKPEDQVYNNNAGTMMDRNLGAVSATPREVGTFGLMYQWGRKDPFLGPSRLDGYGAAKATIPEDQFVITKWETANIDFSIANPTKVMVPALGSGDGIDHYYLPDEADLIRWRPEKTIYDPCPPGYKVPEGGENGVWAKAFGTSEMHTGYPYKMCGFLFGRIGTSPLLLSDSSDLCWYPFAGCIEPLIPNLPPHPWNVGQYGYVWSCSVDDGRSPYAYLFRYEYTNDVFPSSDGTRSCLYPVRCLKEE